MAHTQSYFNMLLYELFLIKQLAHQSETCTMSRQQCLILSLLLLLVPARALRPPWMFLLLRPSRALRPPWALDPLQALRPPWISDPLQALRPPLSVDI